VIGRDCVELAHQASTLLVDAAEFIEHTKRLVNSEETQQTETWQLDDGRTVTRMYHQIGLPDGDCHLWVYHERPDIHRRDNDRREASSRLDALYEHSPDMIDVIDTQGTIRDVNARFCEELGYTEDDVLGRSIWEFDQEVTKSEVLELLGSFAADERRKFDGEYARWDGSSFPVEVHLIRLDLDGEDRFMAISRDISERQAYEAGLNALHGTAQDLLRAESGQQVADIITETVTGILYMPINGVFFFEPAENELQPAAVTTRGKQLITEIPSFGPGSSLAWTVYETEESRRCSDVSTEPGRYNPDTVFRSELIVPIEDHGIILIGSPERNAFGDRDQSLVETLASHAAAVLDRLSQEQELEAQNERLDEFTSVVSHDLRNPLNVAGGRLALAREEHDSEHLAIVARALERSQSLITDLRTLARTGSTIGTTDPINLTELSKECWQTIESRDATLRCDTTLRFEGDRSRVRQVLENLFQNAIEHGGDTVTVGALDDGFYIQDDGPGIPSDKQDSVFDAGYTTTSEGTGFGLNIVAQVAAAHDWTIQVCDNPLGGARFEFINVTTSGAN